MIQKLIIINIILLFINIYSNNATDSPVATYEYEFGYEYYGVTESPTKKSAPTKPTTKTPTKKPVTLNPTINGGTNKPTLNPITNKPTNTNSPTSPTAPTEATLSPVTKKPTKFPTFRPSKRPTTLAPSKFPTKSPTLPLIPTVHIDKVCSTDGGYAIAATACAESWQYKLASGKFITVKGCTDINGAYKPYIDPIVVPAKPVDGGNIGMWCSTIPTYNKASESKSWGYCKCNQFGCTPDTLKKDYSQSETVSKSLPSDGIKMFTSKAKPITPNWVDLLPINYNADAPKVCQTDGGKDVGKPCIQNWTYINAKGVSTAIIGCASMDLIQPAVGGTVSNPVYSQTEKKFWCPTTAIYSVETTSTTKKNWGYCFCPSETLKAGVNTLIASYNSLTVPDRQKLIAKLA